MVTYEIKVGNYIRASLYVAYDVIDVVEIDVIPARRIVLHRLHGLQQVITEHASLLFASNLKPDEWLRVTQSFLTSCLSVKHPTLMWVHMSRGFHPL